MGYRLSHGGPRVKNLISDTLCCPLPFTVSRDEKRPTGSFFTEEEERYVWDNERKISDNPH